MKHINPRPRLNISLTAFPSTMLKTKFFLFLFEFTYVIGRLVFAYLSIYSFNTVAENISFCRSSIP